ncbi:MAG: serine protease [Pleurocapsa sp.]
MTAQTAIIVIGIGSVGWFFHGDISRLKSKILASTSPAERSHTVEVNNIATEISVKILGANFLGSGFILQRQNQEYIVITNQHVLRAGELPYKVQTPDGEIYQAKIISNSDLTNYDLAALQFKSTKVVYKTATIGNSSQLKVGEAIFAAGFPHDDNSISPARSSELFLGLDGFVLKQGRITIFLDKALEEGYQIGYTNDVKKGMSGGPLLNSSGEVIGINGKHAFPLWEAPDFYQDGSQPCAPLQELITRSSLAIPIEKVIGLTPQLTTLKIPKQVLTALEEEVSAIKIESEGLKDPNDVVSTMQAEAEATQNCLKTAN